MIKEYERAKNEILKRFVKTDNNIYYAEKLFIAVSILDWASKKGGEAETFYKYLDYVDKFLYNEIDLYWEDGVVKFRSIKNKRE